jgi:adenosylcobinamide kinase/adenosylcobinamide-phosphate guanylyltransferase
MTSAPASRRVLLLGGARSGKSAAAEARAARAAGPEGRVVYVATAGTRPGDEEWAARVAAHRERRPAGWRTVETADPVDVLLGGEPSVVLVDCVGLWLTRAMDEAGAWDDAAWHARGGARAALDARVAALVEAWRTSPNHVIAVSNEVGMGVVPGTSAGRRFRDELGSLNALLAAAADEVLLVVAGRTLALEVP